MPESPSIKPYIYRAAFVLYLFIVAYLCFANFNDIPDIPRKFLGIRIDKIVHFCMFLPFPAICYMAYGKKDGTPLQALATAVVILAIGCIFAGITEIIQGMLPHRVEDIRDFGADMLGIGISSIITFITAIKGIKRSK